MIPAHRGHRSAGRLLLLDLQALEQALMVIEAQKVDFNEVQRWSIHEGFKDEYESFIAKLRGRKLILSIQCREILLETLFKFI